MSKLSTQQQSSDDNPGVGRGTTSSPPLYVREGEPRPPHSSPTGILVFRWGWTWAIGPWAFTRAKIK